MFPTSMMPEETLMTTNQISEPPSVLAYSIPALCSATGISRRTLYALWERGEGPAVTKIGRRTLVRREAAASWLEQLQVKQAA